jgi:F420-non-reducing hydrogenase iron-sulfur subunit
MSDDAIKVVCFSCKFGWGYAGSNGGADPANATRVPVVCSGKVDPVHILKAFRQGADGVLILGCADGECHYQDGNIEAMKRVMILRRTLDAAGISGERLQIHMGTDPEGKTIPQLVADMSTRVSRLGKLKLPMAAPRQVSLAKR